jgi:sortase A
MMKYIGHILLLVGLGFIVYGGYHIWDMHKQQEEALQIAEAKIAESKDKTKDIDISSYFANYGEEVGLLVIPKLEAILPIVEVVEEDDLEKGVGHYTGTKYPGQNGQIVLSGHRDTVFRRLGELEIGDEFIVKMPYGDFTYVIERTQIVDADDRTVINPDIDEELLTVTTCYPFRYVGSAPDRYIIYAKPKQ